MIQAATINPEASEVQAADGSDSVDVLAEVDQRGGRCEGIKQDSRGRFIAGTRGGPGWVASRRAKIVKAIVSALPTDAYVELIVALHRRAVDGDNDAAKVLLQHVVGKGDAASKSAGGGQTFVFNFPAGVGPDSPQVKAVANLASMRHRLADQPPGHDQPQP